MAESKPDEREIARPPTDAGTTRGGAPLKTRAVPPPLPPTGPRSSRAVRAASPAEGVEAPSLYSQVGRRSSPGMPAVSITVESVGNVTSSRPPPAPAPAPPPAAPPLELTFSPRAEIAPVPGTKIAERPRVRSEESFDFDPDGPPTEKYVGRSARPPAPDPFAADAAGAESIAQTFDRLLGSEVDSRFGEIKQASEAPPALGPGALDDAGDLAEVRDLFEQLAANHVRPVREFVIDLRWGEASREWIAVCSSALDSLQRAAQKLGLKELEAALGTFAGVIQAAAAEPGVVVEGTARDAILAAYERLSLTLPKAFALDLDSSQRESLIIQSLLLQIPEVHRVTIDNLHAAGLNGIAMLAEARPQEVAETTGIGRKLAERIVEVFRAYREESRAHLPDAIHGRERERLDRLLNELEAHHAAFEQAAEGWSKEATAEKARLRRARHKTLMEISVILARSGEIALLKTLEMVPFDRKLDGLRAYLKSAPSSFAHTPRTP
jgi:class 3 adenylate cyclase